MVFCRVDFIAEKVNSRLLKKIVKIPGEVGKVGRGRRGGWTIESGGSTEPPMSPDLVRITQIAS